MKLEISTPYEDDTYTSVKNTLDGLVEYQKQFLHSFVPPHMVIYIFDNMSDDTINLLKTIFRDVFKNTRYESNCMITIKE